MSTLSLFDTLNWIKDKILTRGSVWIDWIDSFNNTKGFISYQITSFDINNNGDVLLKISHTEYNSTDLREYKLDIEYSFNVCFLNRIKIIQVDNNSHKQYGNSLTEIHLFSWNESKTFKTKFFSINGRLSSNNDSDKTIKKEELLTHKIVIPFNQIDDLIKRIEKAFESLIENYGDNRNKPYEPF